MLLLARLPPELARAVCEDWLADIFALSALDVAATSHVDRESVLQVLRLVRLVNSQWQCGTTGDLDFIVGIVRWIQSRGVGLASMALPVALLPTIAAALTAPIVFLRTRTLKLSCHDPDPYLPHTLYTAVLAWFPALDNLSCGDWAVAPAFLAALATAPVSLTTLKLRASSALPVAATEQVLVRHGGTLRVLTACADAPIAQALLDHCAQLTHLELSLMPHVLPCTVAEICHRCARTLEHVVVRYSGDVPATGAGYPDLAVLIATACPQLQRLHIHVAALASCRHMSAVLHACRIMPFSVTYPCGCGAHRAGAGAGACGIRANFRSADGCKGALELFLQHNNEAVGELCADADAETLALLAATTAKHLTALSLRALPGVAGHDLRALLGRCSRLEWLSLRRVLALTDDVVCQLPVLCPGLRAVTLADVDGVGDQGVLAMLQGYLEAGRPLEEVILLRCGEITDAVVEALLLTHRPRHANVLSKNLTHGLATTFVTSPPEAQGPQLKKVPISAYERFALTRS